MSTYTISKLDTVDDDWYQQDDSKHRTEWVPVASGVPLFGIRRHLRYLMRCGYDWDASILVERDKGVCQRSLLEAQA